MFEAQKLNTESPEYQTAKDAMIMAEDMLRAQKTMFDDLAQKKHRQDAEEFEETQRLVRETADATAQAVKDTK